MLNRYRKLLTDWVRSQKDYVTSPVDRPDLAYYGTGTDVWGIQTHMKGFSAFAVAAADSDFDHAAAGYTREEMLALALAMLRFTLESHKTGSYHCTDGDSVRWGHHWLCTLAIERMMHGVDALEPYLTDADRVRIRTVFEDEANYTTDHRSVQADVRSPNVPESNLWSGAFLHRVALRYPDTPRIAEYRRHGTQLLVNSISVPSDAESKALYDGIPASEWFVGANFYESYALCHHSYMNVGYMVICLSNIAMFHFSCKKDGVAAPAALYHHFADLWRLVRSCVFDDGRLYRIGGDTRVRYCYCQDYLTPVFALVADLLGEDMTGEEQGWLSIVESEVAHNGDGSFLSDRCELFRERSPLYYTRLESDRACTLSMLYYWNLAFGDVTRGGVKPTKDILWSEPALGSYLCRTEDRLASFTWTAAEPPQASITPSTDSSLFESRCNLISRVEGGGLMNTVTVKGHSGVTYEGGFLTGGVFTYVTTGLLEENDTSNENAENRIVFCALPDGRSAVTLQLCRTLRRAWLVKVKPLALNIPNDIFNGFTRTYGEADGCITVDGKLAMRAVYQNCDGTLHIEKGEKRTIHLQHIALPGGHLRDMVLYGDRGMLKVDQAVLGGSDTPAWYDKGCAVFDFAALLSVGADCPRGEGYCDGELRAVRLTGADGREYRLIANFGAARTASVFGADLTLDAGEILLLQDGKMIGKTCIPLANVS